MRGVANRYPTRAAEAEAFCLRRVFAVDPARRLQNARPIVARVYAAFARAPPRVFFTTTAATATFATPPAAPSRGSPPLPWSAAAAVQDGCLARLVAAVVPGVDATFDGGCTGGASGGGAFGIGNGFSLFGRLLPLAAALRVSALLDAAHALSLAQRSAFIAAIAERLLGTGAGGAVAFGRFPTGAAAPAELSDRYERSPAVLQQERRWALSALLLMVERLALELEGAATQSAPASASSSPTQSPQLSRAELHACCAVVGVVGDAVGAALRSFGAHDVSLSPFLQDTSALALLLLRARAASTALLDAHGEAAAQPTPRGDAPPIAPGGDTSREVAWSTPLSRVPHVSALWRALALRDGVTAGPPQDADAGDDVSSAAGPLARIARRVAGFAGAANAHGVLRR